MLSQLAEKDWLYQPFHLFGVLLLTGLGLHLLDLNCVGLAAAHVQLVVAHAQGQHSLVDAQTRSKEHKVLRGREHVSTEVQT